jgi:glyoxylase-like metal-dependent hydrolase (beta-lactamase superfamily II)
MGKKGIVVFLALWMAAGLVTFASADGAIVPDPTPASAAGTVAPAPTPASVVQADGWWSALPRASWSQFEKVETSETWFEVYRLPGDVFALYEPGQFQEVISFLILGADKALLWDTGMGIGNIRACVDGLTDLPVVVLNSHSHMDHVSGNAAFEELLAFDSEATAQKLAAGRTVEQNARQLAGDSVWMPLPEGFDPSQYATIGKAPTGTVREGDLIDLGGRALEVVHTPGHAADAIMLIDAENKLLFTGDTYYPAPLYAFSADSNFAEYEASIRKIVEKIAPLDLEWIYASHNEVVQGTEVLGQVLEAMEAISSGAKTDYVVDEDGLRLYTFDSGVRVITRDE